MTSAVIIQARLGSKRFHGKVLAPLAGKRVLERVLEQALRIDTDEIILAVPVGCAALLDVARGYSIKTFEGPADDVLSRYFLAAQAQAIDIVMRITADCPLIDPQLCNKVLDLYRGGYCKYAAIGWPQGGFPKGYGCEVFSFKTLELADQLAVTDEDREHVTTWMQRNVRCQYLQNDIDESHHNYCIDYPEDIDRIEKIIAEREQIRQD